ncbi:hypothetical protein GG344DRAFT_86008 [Lentinula edodes]|nr:hypothetical protein GG344DRAFT_86008 [Lentinula edodes]
MPLPSFHFETSNTPFVSDSDSNPEAESRPSSSSALLRRSDTDEGNEETNNNHISQQNSEVKSGSRWRSMSAFKPILVLENSGSVARDHLALERTFLAYVRTSLAIASTGSTNTTAALVQLFTVSSNSTSNIQSYAQPLGSTSVCLGIVVLLIGLIRYFTVQTALTQGKFPVSRLMIGGIALILLAIVTTVFVVLIAGRR